MKHKKIKETAYTKVIEGGNLSGEEGGSLIRGEICDFGFFILNYLFFSFNFIYYVSFF